MTTAGHWEVWIDRNLAETCATEAEALAACAGYLAANAPDLIDDLWICYEAGNGAATGPAYRGADLLARVRAAGGAS